MDDRDLNRLIDTAAEQIVGHEPSSVLTNVVMERVCDHAPDPRPRPFLWVTAGAATVVCGLLLVMLSKPPALLTEGPTQTRPSAPTNEIGSPVGLAEPPRTANAKAAVSVRRVAKPAEVAVDPEAGSLVAAEAPIVLESIEWEDVEPVSVDVVEVAPPETIQIEPLTIEPRSAATD
jgi:hypothetical protein